jgi:nicotinamide-nucleotide amidase
MARGAGAFFGSDLALATTGYAEPVPARGVTQPLAFWALAHRRADNTVVMHQGRVVRPGAARVEMQEAVADAALAALVSYMREIRVAH